MRRFVFLPAFIVTLTFSLSQARTAPLERIEGTGSSRKSLDLAINGVGVSFGNSPRFTGLRFNLVDSRVEEINGINVTLWKPGENANGIIRGIAMGLYAPRADALSGISLGGLAVVAGSSLSGIAAGGLAVVCEGELSGVAVGGLATVADGALSGISIGGLATVVEGSATGIMAGGLACVTEGSMTGISIGGLATVSSGSFSGLSVSGLAAIAGDDISGIAVAGGSVAAGGDISGITIGGIGTIIKRESSNEEEGTEFSFSYAGIRARNAEWITLHGIDIGVGEKPRGLGAAGVSVRADEIAGVALAGALVKARALTGFSAGAVNYFDGYQIGLSIGLVNFARELNGIQLGIINIAKNNPSPFKVLPVVSAHFE